MLLPTKQVQVQEASNPSKVKVYGPAVDQPCKTFHPSYFMVDCSEAGPGEYRLVKWICNDFTAEHGQFNVY